MSSTGASYSMVYVQQMRQKEKLKKVLELQRSIAKEGKMVENSSSDQDSKTSGKIKKIYPDRDM
ncbi:hypothetical protein CDL12_12891 [Handroanthus impetiginosus]|uniref:Uncharacterized protein n=1 Tax=Handroanthus impetiginosus TaxID=429701 RepID=A0A2G9HAF5_9LAMI|nr:hypothetical protein CDL12_12891 [Handroanthus impetiginosus]